MHVIVPIIVSLWKRVQNSSLLSNKEKRFQPWLGRYVGNVKETLKSEKVLLPKIMSN